MASIHLLNCKCRNPDKVLTWERFKKICVTLSIKCNDCVFLGREVKFDLNISLCHLMPMEKCLRAKEENMYNG